MIKYFHELTPDEFKELASEREGQLAKDFAKDYPQPEWCSYPDAVHPLGCWSLLAHMVTGRSYCKNCDLYIPDGNEPGQPIVVGDIQSQEEQRETENGDEAGRAAQ